MWKKIQSYSCITSKLLYKNLNFHRSYLVCKNNKFKEFADMPLAYSLPKCNQKQTIYTYNSWRSHSQRYIFAYADGGGE